jgi:hypothetical protein
MVLDYRNIWVTMGSHVIRMGFRPYSNFPDSDLFQPTAHTPEVNGEYTAHAAIKSATDYWVLRHIATSSCQVLRVLTGTTVLASGGAGGIAARGQIYKLPRKKKIYATGTGRDRDPPWGRFPCLITIMLQTGLPTSLSLDSVPAAWCRWKVPHHK